MLDIKVYQYDSSVLENMRDLAIPSYEQRFIHMIKHIDMNNIIGCGIDKRPWKLPVDSNNLFNLQQQSSIMNRNTIFIFIFWT